MTALRVRIANSEELTEIYIAGYEKCYADGTFDFNSRISNPYPKYLVNDKYFAWDQGWDDAIKENHDKT